MSTKTLMTVEQFAQMHTADTEDYELVDGELIPLSRGTIRHADIRGLAEHKIRTYFEGNPIGRVYAEVDCLVPDNIVRRPDLSIFLNERLLQIDLDRIPAPFAPDIAVEVLSPSESATDLRVKIREYLRGGSKEVWLLDHVNREVAIHTGSYSHYLQGPDVLESALLPGFSVRVGEVVGESLKHPA
jgi:Uma2 family endonuclease